MKDQTLTDMVLRARTKSKEKGELPCAWSLRESTQGSSGDSPSLAFNTRPPTRVFDPSVPATTADDHGKEKFSKVGDDVELDQSSRGRRCCGPASRS